MCQFHAKKGHKHITQAKEIMGRIHMIRHGQASFGAENYDSLSDLGRKQAKILGKSLARHDRVFDAIYQGTLERQTQTAKEVIGCINKEGYNTPRVITLNALNEYDALTVWKSHLDGVIEENPFMQKDLDNIETDPKAFQRLFEQVTNRWISGEHDRESAPRWKDFKIRVTKGLRTIMESHGPGSEIAVVTSAGTISVAMQQSLGLSDKKTLELSWQILNSSVTRFRYNGNRIALSGFNDISHLEATGNRDFLTYR